MNFTTVFEHMMYYTLTYQNIYVRACVQCLYQSYRNTRQNIIDINTPAARLVIYLYIHYVDLLITYTDSNICKHLNT